MSSSNDRIGEFISTLTPEEAMETFHALRSEFNLIGAVFSSEDVHEAVVSELESPLLMFEPCDALPELTDALRDAVASSSAICRDITAEMIDSGRPVLNVAVEMLIVSLKENPTVQLDVGGEVVLVTGFKKLDDAFAFARSSIDHNIQDVIATAEEEAAVVSCPNMEGVVCGASLLATSFDENFVLNVDPPAAGGPTLLSGLTRL